MLIVLEWTVSKNFVLVLIEEKFIFTKPPKEWGEKKETHEKIKLTGISVLLCSDLETSFLPDCSVPRAKYLQKRKGQELH